MTDKPHTTEPTRMTMQTTRRRDFPINWADDAAWRYSPEIKKDGSELVAKVHPTGFEIHACHQDGQRGIQEIVIIPATVEEARALGEWLCKRSDQIRPKRGLRAWLARKLDR